MNLDELDNIDKKLLKLLQDDSRQPLTTLADKAGLSASACHRRIKLLEDGDIYPDITKGSSISEEYAGTGAEFGGTDYGAQGTVTH